MKDDRGKLDLTKQIEVLKAEVELLSTHLGEAYVKIKTLNESNARLVEENSNFLKVNESHKKLNGELREELANVRKALTRIPWSVYQWQER